jgi:rubrerythrin
MTITLQVDIALVINMENKLTRLLKQAHAIEIGAYNAYEGHWRSLAKNKLSEARRIVEIQGDERAHMLAVERFLRTVNAKPSKIQDAILWIIGKSISIACYIMGYRAAMWGAKVMEVMGSNIYEKLAKVARDEGYPAMGVELDYMQRSEIEHEEFFKSCLEKK